MIAAFVVLFPHKGVAVGAYQDVSRAAYFVIAPQVSSLEARVTRSKASENEAYIYTVASLMPYKSLLFQLEIPYISYVRPDSLRSQFGDPVLRMRVRVWHGQGWSFNLLSGVRAGSLPFFESNEDLYPFSTGSLDLSFGIAVVDTVASVPWWVSGTGTYATRVQETLQDIYGDYATAATGFFIPFLSRFDAQLGAVLRFQSGEATRQTYYADVDARYSQSIGFYAFGQVEAGPESARAADNSLGLGMTVTF